MVWLTQMVAAKRIADVLSKTLRSSKVALMSKNHGPYHRLGQPGGPGCKVTALAITTRGPEGTEIPGHLLDAGTEASELELLRTVASGLGVRWGHDDLGWWAVVAPNP